MPVAEKPYHNFVGWFTSATGGTQISSSQTITSDRTYYAHYEIPENLYQRVNGKWVPGKMYQYYSGAWHQVIPLTYHKVVGSNKQFYIDQFRAFRLERSFLFCERGNFL